MDLIWLFLGYLAGSCPTGYLAAKLVRGEDIRRHGSGNIGATNVGRLMGKSWAVAVAVLDMAKGGLVVGAAWLFGVRDPWILSLTGAAGVLGHNYPLWLGFKGGKGVATTLGVLLGLAWPIGVATAATWLALAVAFRYSSLAALGAVLFAPVYTAWFTREGVLVAAVGAMTLVLLWRHRANIRRLLAGEEPKIGASRPSA